MAPVECTRMLLESASNPMNRSLPGRAGRGALRCEWIAGRIADCRSGGARSTRRSPPRTSRFAQGRGGGGLRQPVRSGARPLCRRAAPARILAASLHPAGRGCEFHPLSRCRAPGRASCCLARAVPAGRERGWAWAAAGAGSALSRRRGRRIDDEARAARGGASRRYLSRAQPRRCRRRRGWQNLNQRIDGQPA